MVNQDVLFYEGAIIGKNVTIGKGSIVYPNVQIGDNTFVGPYSILGEPMLGYYKDPSNHIFEKTIIGENSIIRSNCILYEGVVIGKEFQTGHHVTIREKTRIGIKCSVGTLSDLQGEIIIGDFVRLHSNVHISQKTIIEDFVWIYPYTITTNDAYPPMGNLKGCVVRKFAQIATGSKLMPGIEVGENALVGAGSIVTHNVKPYTVVLGSPAKERGSILDIKNDNDENVYPWKEHLNQYRGYPWQTEVKKHEY